MSARHRLQNLAQAPTQQLGAAVSEKWAAIEAKIMTLVNSLGLTSAGQVSIVDSGIVLCVLCAFLFGCMACCRHDVIFGNIVLYIDDA